MSDTTAPPIGFGSSFEPSKTPRTDAFVRELAPIRMNQGPLVAAQDMREQMIAWAEFARQLEIECAQKVWPH